MVLMRKIIPFNKTVKIRRSSSFALHKLKIHFRTCSVCAPSCYWAPPAVVLLVNFCSLRFLISSCSVGLIPEAVAADDDDDVDSEEIRLGPAVAAG